MSLRECDHLLIPTPDQRAFGWTCVYCITRKTAEEWAQGVWRRFFGVDDTLISEYCYEEDWWHKKNEYMPTPQELQRIDLIGRILNV